MLGVTLVIGVTAVVAVYWGAKTAMAFGRDVRGHALPQRGELLPRGGEPVRHALPHDALDERHPAGADARADIPHPDHLGSDHCDRRDLHGVPDGCPALPPADRDHPDHGRGDRPHRDARRTDVPGRAGEARHHQPRDAGEPQRDPRDPGVRPHRLRRAALRRGERRPHGHHAAGDTSVRRADALDHADPQPLDRRRDVVREPARRQRQHADRQPHGLPHLSDADPVLGLDGDDHVRDGSAGGRLSGPHPGGARRRAGDHRSRQARARAGAPGNAGVPRRRVPIPRRRGAGPVGHHLHDGAR